MEKDRRQLFTIALIVINIAVFFGLSVFGDTQDIMFMVEHGAMFEPLVVEGHEYYRLFTCLFLHFGIEHLMNNMVMLGALGWNVEEHLGKIRFLLIYFAAGLGGNLLSLFINIRGERLVVSAGASGAIFGLMGALVMIVMKNRGRLYSFTKRRMALMVFLSLYFGFTSSGTDNAAHVGGLIVGFLLTGILYRKPQTGETSSHRMENGIY